MQRREFVGRATGAIVAGGWAGPWVGREVPGRPGGHGWHETSAWLNLTTTLFSRRGCWLNLALTEGRLGPGLYLRSNHSRPLIEQEHFLFELSRDGNALPATYTASAAAASVVAIPRDTRGSVEFILEGSGTLRARGSGVGIRIRSTMPLPASEGYSVAAAAEIAPGRYMVNQSSAFLRYQFSPIRGRFSLLAGWDGTTSRDIAISADDENWELAIDQYRSTWVEPRRQSFDSAQASAARDFERFLAGMPPVPKALENARAHAAYVLWSCTKSPRGLLRRTPVLMSMQWMDGLWSWDNLFNAVAIASADSALAMDQVLLFADHQDQFGAYPDLLSDTAMQYNFHKPPVQGVLFSEWERRRPGDWAVARSAPVVESVARFTQWWLNHRRWPGHTLAHYQHGNDSGWDNSTLFLRGIPLESPDLNALLVRQCEWLAAMSARAGRRDEAEEWRRVSGELLTTLLRDLWRGDQFVGRLVPSGEMVASQSLLDCIPIVLGPRLPPEVATALVRRVRTFITLHGLATEQLESVHYTPDGYWRGPIWGPSTLLVVLGLESLGEKELAQDLARGFCELCIRSGFPENFDARSGAPLRDPCYTWTASAFLLLSERLNESPGARGR